MGIGTAVIEQIFFFNLMTVNPKFVFKAVGGGGGLDIQILVMGE